jgi:hypothetical protein
MAQIASAAMTSTVCRWDSGAEPRLALIQAQAVLPQLKILFHRPSQPGRPDQPRLGQQLPFGDVAAVKGQLTGAQMTPHEAVMARAGSGDPGPGIPPLTLGPLASGADLPAPRVRQQPHLFRRLCPVPGSAEVAGDVSGGGIEVVGVDRDVDQDRAVCLGQRLAEYVELAGVAYAVSAGTERRG